MNSETSQQARISKSWEVFEKEIEAEMALLGMMPNQTRVIVSENSMNTVNINTAAAFELTEQSVTDNELQQFSQPVDYAFEKVFTKT